MNLELTPEEHELLLEVLHGRMGELRQEIYHATVSTFKDELKEREALLQGLIQNLEAGATTSQET